MPIIVINRERTISKAIHTHSRFSDTKITKKNTYIFEWFTEGEKIPTSVHGLLYRDSKGNTI